MKAGMYIVPELPAKRRTHPDQPRDLFDSPPALIGRKRQVHCALEALTSGEVHLLTITGPPGIGKTRLALQVAYDARDCFPDGVYFVPLAAITDPHMVVTQIAQAIGLQEAGSKSLHRRVADFLRDKRMLLVLDNFEQVAQAGPAVGELVASAPSCRVLVTSRKRLQIYCEHELTLGPLDLPDPERDADPRALARIESVELFVRRARAANLDFRLTRANSRAVAEICRYLDGIPLAIELAAARTRLLTPQTMLLKLKQPKQRLLLLRQGATDLPERQRTLQSALDWSFALLDDSLRALLARLAVFVHGCSLPAIEAVAACHDVSAADQRPPATGHVLDGLAALVDSSLLQQEEAPGGETRFTMLETIREYALDRLEQSGDAQDIRRRHARFYTQIAEEVDRAMRAPVHRGDEWLLFGPLEADLDNLRAALEWATGMAEQGDAEGASLSLRLAGALRMFWEMRDHIREGRDWCRRVLSAAQVGSDEFCAPVEFALGRLSWFLGDSEEALHAYDLCFHRWDKLGDRWGTSLVAVGRGLVFMSQGDLPAARGLFEASLRTRRELQHPWGIAYSLDNLAVAVLRLGEPELALALLDECLLVARRSRSMWAIVHCLRSLGDVLCRLGIYDRAAAVLEEGYALSMDSQDRLNRAHCVMTLGRVALAGGNRPQAAILFGAAGALYEVVGTELLSDERPQHESDLASLRGALGEVRFKFLWEQGKRMLADQLLSVIRKEFKLLQVVPSPIRRKHNTPIFLPASDLSPRELDVLRHLAQGLTNAEIAARMTISRHTVSMHVRSIFSKLDVTSRSAATHHAFVHNLI